MPFGVIGGKQRLRIPQCVQESRQGCKWGLEWRESLRVIVCAMRVRDVRDETAGGASCRMSFRQLQSIQSAIKMFVSPCCWALRLEAKTNCLPSEVNIGKPSKLSSYVIRSSPDPSALMR